MSAGRKIQYLHLKRPGEKPEKVAIGQELNSGGAGTIYSIKDNPDLVIKIYHEDTLNREGESYREKIECMLVNAPNVSDIQTSMGRIVQLAWPVASAYDLKGSFVGFAMPTIDLQHTTELEYALTEKAAKQYRLRHDLEARISLAHNLAAVVSNINARGHAIVDLKPTNLKFYKESLCVAVLDCDGFFINIPEKKGNALQVTLEYLAPEFHGAPVTHPEHQDRFALAVIIFQLFNYGTHPFAGVPNPNENLPDERVARIKDGLYPYGISPHKKVHPVQVSIHEAFSQELRDMFDRAFSMRPARRPSSDEWRSALKKYLDKSKKLLEHCPSGHLHFSAIPRLSGFSGKPCLSCFREQILIDAASGNRSKQPPSKTPLTRPPWIQAAPQPQARVASLSGSLQQGVSQPHHTQSQAPVQSAPPATQAMNINSAPIKRGAVALILVVGMLWYFADMVKTRFAGPQSVSVAAQQANTKQKSPQDAIPQPDTAPATIADTPAEQDPTPIAVQESIDSSRSESSLVAGSTVGPENEGASGTLGWLGIDAQTLPEERAPMKLDSMPRWMDINKQRGMIINVVVKGSPADIAGMVVGDLLVAVDNKAVDTDDATRNVVSNIPVGRVVPIKIIRDGREMYLLLTITQRP